MASMTVGSTDGPPWRPAEICAALLATLEASEGRSQRRKRDQTSDRIGLSIKRMLLEHAVADPDPEAFEEWLLEQCLSETTGSGMGPTRAMALEILTDVKLSGQVESFGDWLADGAPSADADPAPTADPPRQRRAP